ncbi:hypothetical protein TNCV_2083151 [Trichonephila clavipes]|nr:hypothetical protein TNCV_2083151 [Trichonephila clavipes]
MKLSLLKSHASVCNTTMVGILILETPWREDAEQLCYVPPYWSCTGKYGMGQYCISFSHSLVCIASTLNSQRYISEVLDFRGLTFFSNVGFPTRMFAVCGVPQGGKWCPGNTFGPRFAVDAAGMTGTLPPLLDSVVGGGTPDEVLRIYGSNAAVPRGVLFPEPDLLTTSNLKSLKDFQIRCDSGQKNYNKKNTTVFPTKHLILTFNSPNLPTSIKAGYLNCKIRPYIPNPCAVSSARGSTPLKLPVAVNLLALDVHL